MQTSGSHLHKSATWAETGTVPGEEGVWDWPNASRPFLTGFLIQAHLPHSVRHLCEAFSVATPNSTDILYHFLAPVVSNLGSLSHAPSPKGLQGIHTSAHQLCSHLALGRRLAHDKSLINALKTQKGLEGE